MKNIIKNNFINSNIKFIVLIINTGHSLNGFNIEVVSTVPFLTEEDAVNYINDLETMGVQGLIIDIKNTLEDDILKDIEEAKNLLK